MRLLGLRALAEFLPFVGKVAVDGSGREHWCDVLVPVSGKASADGGDAEERCRVGCGVFQQFIDICPNGVERERVEMAILGRDRVGNSGACNAGTVYGSVVLPRVQGRALAVTSGFVAPEDEDFSGGVR